MGQPVPTTPCPRDGGNAVGDGREGKEERPLWGGRGAPRFFSRVASHEPWRAGAAGPKGGGPLRRIAPRDISIFFQKKTPLGESAAGLTAMDLGGVSDPFVQACGCGPM